MSMINKRYNIVSILGKGGFGEVYKIEDTYENNKILAMKKILSSVLTERSVNIFKFEFKFLTSLNHPNLVKVYDFNIDKESDELFFTMEFIEGRTLYKACREGINWTLIEDYLIQSARALAYIHSKEIIHYDIKPDNILIDRKNNLKLMDFGFAGSKDDSRVRGTIQFMAPDFVLKVPITNKIDFFSLGATFYYSITGHLPFQGCTKEEMLKKCARGDYIPIQEMMPEMPPHLAAVITKLMQTNPRNRYNCATEIIIEINKLAHKIYPIFTENDIRAYIKSGKLFGRKKELDVLNGYAYTVLEKENFYDNMPVVLSGKDGHGKKAILREFRYLIQLKEDIDYFTANFFAADENVYQAFEVIIEEMIRLYNLSPSECQPVSFLLDSAKNLEEQNEITVFTSDSDSQQQIDAVCSFLTTLATQHPMVIDLRNFNFAASASILLLENLLKTIRKCPEKEIRMVLIISVQSDKLPAYHKIFINKISPYTRLLEIDCLNQEQSGEYIKELLMLKEFPDDYTATILEYSKGIPYYINEIFIYLFSQEILTRDESGWVLDEDYANRINKSNQQITYYNFKMLDKLEQLIIKELFVLERPVNYNMLGVFSSLSDASPDDVSASLHQLCNKEIIEKIKYSDGYRYYLANDLFLDAIKNDFTQQEYINLNRTSADFIKNNFGINSRTIYALADYFFRSKEKEKTPNILKTAINKAYEDRNYELALIYMEKLFSIETNIANQQNIFIAILNVLELLHSYQVIINRIGDFFISYTNITPHNILEINLKKYNSALKLALNQPLSEATDWFLKTANISDFNQDDLAKYYIWQGGYYRNRGDYDQAYSLLSKAGKIYKKMSKHLSLASVDFEIVQLLPKIGKHIKVQKILLSGLSIFEYYRDYPRICKTYELLGDNYLDFDHDAKALQYYHECLKLAKTRNDLKFEIIAEIKIAKIKMMALQVNESLELLTKNIQILETLDDFELTAEVFFEISRIYFFCGRIKEADSCIDRSIEIDIRLNKDAFLIRSYLHKIHILLLKNDIQQINILLNLIEKMINKNDSDNLAQYFFLCGSSSGDFDKKQSLKCFKKAFSHAFKPTSLTGIINLDQQKSLAEEIMNNPKKALQYSRSAYDFFNNNLQHLNNNRVLKVKTEILFNRQRAYLGEHEEAIISLSKLISFLETYDIPIEKGRAKFYLGKIYFDIGDSSKAIYFFDAARFELKKIPIEIRELKELNRIYPEKNYLTRNALYD